MSHKIHKNNVRQSTELGTSVDQAILEFNLKIYLLSNDSTEKINILKYIFKKQHCTHLTAEILLCHAALQVFYRIGLKIKPK